MNKKPNKQKHTGGGLLPESKQSFEVEMGKAETFVPPIRGDTTVRVTAPDNTVPDLQAKIEEAKEALREICHVGRNPACGIARKALVRLES